MELRFLYSITETKFHLMHSKSRNFLLTINNPDSSLKEWLDSAKSAGADCARAQLERGENGTEHI